MPSLYLRRTAILLLAVVCLNGCASHHSRVDNAMGGAIAGAMVGGAGGAVCCGDPVDGLPVGIIAGAILGGIVGYVWPTDLD